jgi:hypothetical protein
MARKLRYSERKQVAETGSLGPLQDSPSEALRNVIIHVFQEGAASRVSTQFLDALRKTCIEFFGWSREEAERMRYQILHLEGDDFLDFLEIFVEEASTNYEVSDLYSGWPESAIPDIGNRLNGLFERHRFGYRFEGAELRKINSPALDDQIVGPALLAVKRPGWEEVEGSFKEAIQHQRAGADENDDALTSANSAVEAALKATGFKGANLGPLSKDFKNSSHVPSELKGVPEALGVLIGRSGALRSSYGDSHGKEPGAKPVPDALVALAINWAAAFIVYLSETIPENG